ncbi:MAG: response regulator [Sideroxyarcus sp.]|nr:response regulator [Sideroxyarcus sp.]
MSDISRVFVVDDDASVRDSLRMLLEVSGYKVATFPGAEDFLEICTPDTQGCIILDVNMPDMDGPTLQEELLRREMQLPIIFLSGHGTIPLTVRALKSGAMNFLIKPVQGAELLACVHEAMEQSNFLRMQARACQSVTARLAALTEREREVMSLAVEGKTSKEIAQQLNISYRTVEIHRAHVMQKTGATNMLELARITSQLTTQ